MSIRIEDCFEDVLSKAQAGLGLDNAELAEKAGVSEEAVVDLKKGNFDAKNAVVVADALGVDPTALEALAKGWRPEVEAPAGLYCFNTPFPVPGYAEMTVNAYVVADLEARVAVAFDTGADVTDMLTTLRDERLTLKAIFITHAHSDHVKDLLTLKDETDAPAYTPEKEKVAGAETFEPGEKFTIGKLEIRTVETSGHSPGGVTYIIKGLPQPVAIVGDAIFAGSMGGAAKSWEKAQTMIREGILSLPGDTVLCPGHGPLTTVLEELGHNPYFANTI